MAQRDDDRYWHLAGTVYANRRDPPFSCMHARLGSSSTINLGHPGAWVIVGALAVVVLLAASGIIDLPWRESLF